MARNTLGLGVSAIALLASAPALGQSAPDCVGTDKDYCVITIDGASGSVTVPSPAQLVNTGAISGQTGVSVTAVNVPNTAVSAMATIQNRAGASITGTGGTAVAGGAMATLINAGTINGNVVGVRTYVSDGGTLTGNLQLGAPVAMDFGSQTYVQRGANSGVSGTISAGSGIDFYVRSHAASTNVTLGAPLPVSFEVEGVEARGAGTVVTTQAAAGTSIGGLYLMGDGQVVNQATIGTFNQVGANFPVPVMTSAIAYGGVPETSGSVNYTLTNPMMPQVVTGTYSVLTHGALTSFTNEGVVNGDIRLSTAAFVNSGDINLVSGAPGTLILSAQGQDFAFNNSGTISYVDTGNRTGPGLIEANQFYDDTANAAVRLYTALGATGTDATISNSGEITGGLATRLVVDSLNFTNSGEISGLNGPNITNNGVSLVVQGAGVIEEDHEEILAEQVSFLNDTDGVIADGVRVDALADNLLFENRGRITGGPEELRALSIDQYGLENDDGDSIDNASFAFINSGVLVGDVVLNMNTLANSLTNSGTIVMPGTGGFHPWGYPSEALEVEVETDASHTIAFTNSGDITQNNRGAVALSFEVESLADSTINLINSGEIRSDAGATLIAAAANGYGDGLNHINVAAALAVQGGYVEGVATANIRNDADGIISATGTVANVTPAGVVNDLGGRGSTIAVYADVDVVNLTNAGTIQGGVAASHPASVILSPDSDFVKTEGRIGGAIQTINSVDIIENLATGVISGDVNLGAQNDIFRNYGELRDSLVYLGDGDDQFVQSLATGVFTGNVRIFGGAGTDLLTFDLTGSNGVIAEDLLAYFDGFELQSMIGSGNLTSDSEVVLGDGGALELSEGSVINVPGGTAISGGAGAETLTNEGTVNGNVDLGGGNNQLVNRAVINGDVIADGGNNQLSNAGSIKGNVVLGTGNDRFENTGLIDGNVDLGGGANVFVLGSGSAVTGTVAAGTGQDQLQVNTANATSAPLELSGNSFTGFEALTNSAGTTAVSGNLSLGAGGQFNVAGGYLFGRQGSVMTGNVGVASGAAFGSAGTVNGNVAVASGGTLSPGASPGIMTINGNVSLAAGTTTLFEFVPAPGQSDQVIIDGSLAIASGATLTLTGQRPLTPGVNYSLITASDGITGTYTTVNQGAGVLGFLRYTDTQLQLLGTFVAPTGTSLQANAAIDYVNAVLVSGSANSALMGNVHALLTPGGNADPAAFILLTPESYATAAQLSVEQGLAIARAGRTGLATTSRTEAGLFGFSQVLGNWRSLSADNAIGTSGAQMEGFGILGGIGFGNETFSLGLFGGRQGSQQNIDTLRTRADADGTVAGAVARFSSGGFAIDLLAARDWSEVSSSRAVPGSMARSHYTLRSWVLDGSVSAALPLSESWAIRPTAGITHVAVDRGAAQETGSAAYALAVASGNHKATFVDGSIKLEGGQNSTVQPWIQLGVRHQLAGERFTATGRLPGATTGFSVTGAPREDTLAIAGVGVRAEVSRGVSLFGSYLGEFGDGNNHNANLGVSFAF